MMNWKSVNKRNFDLCLSLHSRHKCEPFLHRMMIIGFFFTMENDKDEIKMVSVWWSSVGIIHYRFMRSSHSIVVDVYGNQMDKIMKIFTKEQLILLVTRNRPIFCQHMMQQKRLKTGTRFGISVIHRIHRTSHQLTIITLFQTLFHFLQRKIFNSRQLIHNVFRDFTATRRWDK